MIDMTEHPELAQEILERRRLGKTEEEKPKTKKEKAMAMLRKRIIMGKIPATGKLQLRTCHFIKAETPNTFKFNVDPAPFGKLICDSHPEFKRMMADVQFITYKKINDGSPAKFMEGILRQNKKITTTIKEAAVILYTKPNDDKILDFISEEELKKISPDSTEPDLLQRIMENVPMTDVEVIIVAYKFNKRIDIWAINIDKGKNTFAFLGSTKTRLKIA